MFKALQTLLAGVTSLNLSLVANGDDTITVTVHPKGSKTGNTLDTPLSLTATAAELDEGFANVLLAYSSKRQNLVEQLAATEAILEAAQKEASDKAKKSLAKPGKKSSTESETPDDDDDHNHDDDDDAGSSCTPAQSVSTPSTKPAPAASSEATDLWA